MDVEWDLYAYITAIKLAIFTFNGVDFLCCNDVHFMRDAFPVEYFSDSPQRSEIFHQQRFQRDAHCRRAPLGLLLRGIFLLQKLFFDEEGRVPLHKFF